MSLMKSLPIPFNETESAILRAVEMYEDFLTENPDATPVQIYARFNGMDLARIVFHMYKNKENKKEVTGNYLTDYEEICEKTNGVSNNLLTMGLTK